MVVYDPNKSKYQDEQQSSGQQQQGATNATTISGGGTDAGNNTPAQKQPGAPTSSGSFVNLQSYLDANKDQNFGQQVAGKVDQDTSAADKAQSDANTGFKSDVDKNTVNWNPDLVQKATSDPSKFLQNQSDVDSFTKQRDAKYTGPKGLEEESSLYNPAYEATNKAQQNAAATDSESGRKSLLDQYYGRPDYQTGQKNLDNLLIQNDQGSRQAFAQSRDNAKKTSSSFEGLRDQLANYAGTAGANTDYAGQQTRNALFGEGGDKQKPTGGAIGDLQNSVNKVVTDSNAKAKGTYSDLLAALQSNHFTPEQAQQLGIGNLIGKSEYTSQIDPTSYLSPTQQATAYNTATSDQYARMGALSKLAGADNTFLPDSYKDQAGTFNGQPQYKADQLADALKSANDQYQYGLSGTSLKDVATKAGVDPGSIFNYQTVNPYYRDLTFDEAKRQLANDPYGAQQLAAIQSIVDKYSASQGGNKKFGA